MSDVTRHLKSDVYQVSVTGTYIIGAMLLQIGAKNIGA